MSTSTNLTADHSIYRDLIHESLNDWPEFAWLNRFLHTPKPLDTPDTEVFICDILDGRAQIHKVENDLSKLQTELLSEPPSSCIRFVLVSYSESWDIDRNILDAIAYRFAIDPRF